MACSIRLGLRNVEQEPRHWLTRSFSEGDDLEPALALPHASPERLPIIGSLHVLRLDVGGRDPLRHESIDDRLIGRHGVLGVVGEGEV